MIRLRWLILVAMATLIACQSQAAPAVTIVDGANIVTVQAQERTPAELLAQAGIALNPGDRVLSNGAVVPLDRPLAEDMRTLQVRRTVTLTLTTDSGQVTIPTAAFTIGEALGETGMQLYASDLLDPPAETPIDGPLAVTYRPARELTVAIGGKSVKIRSAAATVGEALAEAGIPLIGLDTSQPGESEPLPIDGQVKVVRVQESVVLIQKPLPFSAEFQASAEIEIDHQDLLQVGQPGLAVSRVRVRYEDGVEVARRAEAESVVRQPRNQIVGYGTKVVVRSLEVPGGTIQYWRAVKMYATSYSPCRSGSDRCYSGTSSGKPVQKGVVAVVRRWWAMMVGQPVYVPGYGTATIEDIGAGIPDKLWIDLGYSDSDWVEWGDWVTVYFLTPVPANILWVLN
jgi:uncharacterized protein YabE (DUF348 family)